MYLLCKIKIIFTNVFYASFASSRFSHFLNLTIFHVFAALGKQSSDNNAMAGARTKQAAVGVEEVLIAQKYS